MIKPPIANNPKFLPISQLHAHPVKTRIKELQSNYHHERFYFKNKKNHSSSNGR